MNEQSIKPDRRSAVIAIIVIAVGAVFLLGELFNFRAGSGFWPLFILVPGLVLLYSAFSGSTANAGTAGSGAVLTTLGLVFFFQNSTGNWESWAYVWALLPLSAGVAQTAAGTRNDDESLIATGRNITRTFGIVFLAGLVFFELLIFDRGGFGGYLLPIALIAVGTFMLWLNYRRAGSLPFADMFPGAGTREPQAPQPPAPTNPGETAVAPTAEQPPTAATPTTHTTAATPPTAARAASAEATTGEAHFPEDELPHEPPPDDAPFPADEESPETSAPKPKPRRRSSGARTRKAATPPSGGSRSES